MKDVDLKFIEELCLNSVTMAQAAAKAGLSFSTFKRYALEAGCYRPNQSGKGIPKKGFLTYQTDEILNGNVPHFQTYKLKRRLIQSRILDHKCFVCGINEWNGKKLNLELDHIDGNRNNHRLENLRLLCPNCHSQTETYRGKNVKRKNLSAL